MLTYTTQPLEQDLTIIGPVKAVLFGTSTAPDTDWVFAYVMSGRMAAQCPVCDGILRARYRNSLEWAELWYQARSTALRLISGRQRRYLRPDIVCE